MTPHVHLALIYDAFPMPEQPPDKLLLPAIRAFLTRSAWAIGLPEKVRALFGCLNVVQLLWWPEEVILWGIMFRPILFVLARISGSRSLRVERGIVIYTADVGNGSCEEEIRIGFERRRAASEML